MSEAPKEASSGGPRPEIAVLIGKLSEVGGEFMTAQEWGIFKGSGEKSAALEDQIVSALEVSRKEAEAGHIAEAQTALLRAKSALVRAQQQDWWYRWNNRAGVWPIALTLCAATVAFFGVELWMLNYSGHNQAAHAALLGLFGATLRSLYWLQFQLGKGQLRPRWFGTFLVAPFIGVLLGAFSYLMVLVGSKLVSGDVTDGPDILAVGLFAGFAGYNWEWALEKFLIIANTFAGKTGMGSGAKESKRSERT